jgi:hypothetical protein
MQLQLKLLDKKFAKAQLCFSENSGLRLIAPFPSTCSMGLGLKEGEENSC